jgi:hypothetical protein
MFICGLSVDRFLMETSFVFLIFFSLGCLILCLVRSWHYVALLALIELTWVVLIATFSSLSLIFLDLTFLYWGLLLFIFSAVEVTLGFISFLLYARHNRV